MANSTSGRLPRIRRVQLEAARTRRHATPSARTETPEGNLFFQLAGPTDLVEGERENFLSLVRSVK